MPGLPDDAPHGPRCVPVADLRPRPVRWDTYSPLPGSVDFGVDPDAQDPRTIRPLNVIVPAQGILWEQVLGWLRDPRGGRYNLDLPVTTFVARVGPPRTVPGTACAPASRRPRRPRFDPSAPWQPQRYAGRRRGLQQFFLGGAYFRAYPQRDEHGTHWMISASMERVGIAPGPGGVPVPFHKVDGDAYDRGREAFILDLLEAASTRGHGVTVDWVRCYSAGSRELYGAHWDGCVAYVQITPRPVARPLLAIHVDESAAAEQPAILTRLAEVSREWGSGIEIRWRPLPAAQQVATPLLHPASVIGEVTLLPRQPHRVDVAAGVDRARLRALAVRGTLGSSLRQAIDAVSRTLAERRAHGRGGVDVAVG